MPDRFQNHANDIPVTAGVPCRVVKESGEVTEKETGIIVEKELEVSVNGIPAFRLTCTPEHLTELILGRLCTEGIIRNAEEVEHLFICGEGNIAEVRLTEDCTFEPYTGAEPTCCTGNRQLIQRAGEESAAVLPKVTPEPGTVFGLAEHFRRDGELHRSTGGAHSCYLRLEDGQVLSFEDVGRHNALDKAVGAMLLAHADPGSCILFTTGRVAEDLARKVIAAGIPVLISKAVPTEAAVRLSKEAGLTLICRAWPDSYELYS